MANRVISIEDKRIVVQRLAEGMSTRQAIEGTNIRSNQTASRIGKEYSHRIAQLRGKYSQKLEENINTNVNERVLKLSKLMNANKPFVYKGKKKNDIYYWSNHSSKDLHENDLIWIPEWDIQLKTIKYIDFLSGINQGKGTQINVVQQIKN